MIPLRVLLVVLAASSPLFAQGDTHSLARLLPADTPFFLETTTPPIEEMRKTAMGRMLDDPAVAKMMNALFADKGQMGSDMRLHSATIRLAWAMDAGAFGMRVLYRDLDGERTTVLKNNFTMAWMGLNAGPVPVDVVAAIEVDTNPAGAIEILQRIAASGVHALQQMKGKQQVGTVAETVAKLFKDVDHKGATFSVGTFEGISLYFAPVGKLVVIATSEARVRDILDRQAGRSKSPALVDDGRYKEQIQRIRGTGTVTTMMLLHADRALDVVGAAFPDQVAGVRGMMTVLGLDGLRSLTTVARVDGSGFSSRTSVTVSGERRGLARLFNGGKPATLNGFAFAPKQTLFAHCGNFDAAGLFDIIVEASAAMGDHGGMRMQADFEKAFGLRLREDLLQLLGKEMTIIVAPNKGLIPDIGIVFASPDADRLERSLLALLKKAPLPPETKTSTFKFDGRTIHAVPMMRPELDMVPLAPTFGVVDGYFLVAPFPLSFRRLAEVKKGSNPALAANRDFARLRELVPADALDMSYMDVRRMYELLHATAMPILQAFPAASGGRNPLYELPEADVVSRHLYGRVAWRTADDLGMHWHAHSSVDTSGLMVGALAGAAAGGALVSRTVGRPVGPPPIGPPPPVKGKDDRAKRMEVRQCGYNVRSLRAHLVLYKQENGRLPDSLESIATEHMDKGTFNCPGAGKKYAYFGPAGKGRVILHGFANGSDGRVTILTKDFAIRRVPAKQLEKLLAR